MIINGTEYTTGIDRAQVGLGKKIVAHLYRGPFAHPGAPMCKRGYNRPPDGYSIFRNTPGYEICKICMRRAEANKKPIIIKKQKRIKKWQAQ